MLLPRRKAWQGASVNSPIALPDKGAAMAKKQRRKSGRSGKETAPIVATQDEASASPTGARRTMAGRKGLRRRLRKLEGQLAAAAQQERRRLRKLERALWRPQRIEAAIDEIRTATSLIKASATKPVPDRKRTRLN